MAQALHLRLPDDVHSAVVRLAVTEERTILDMVRKLVKEALAARSGHPQSVWYDLSEEKSDEPRTRGQ